MSMGSRPNRSALRERDQQVVERLSRPKSVTPPVCSAKKGGHGRHNSENLNPDEFSIVRVNNNNNNAGSSELGVPKTGSKRPPRHLPPRPPSAKRKLETDSFVDAQQTPSERHASLCASNDSGVQVIVRIRPMRAEENEVTPIVHLLSQNTIAVVDQQFTYDAVAGDESTQKDIFEMVGVPLVENCMAGFNSSIFAYGQTGSGKTYTMWGPMYDLSGELFPNKDRGLTPRVFEQLFARIEEEEAKNIDKQLRYQCRCSFLEIYNEQITDLLEPNQKNLQVREDTKCGVYVDNLTEEYVSSVDDVSRLALRGLANRKVGATNMNAESSRSHSVFTCVLESRYKCATSGLSSLKTSRINLVDLAGSERQKSTGAVGERLKEAGNINRSLSQLGNLIKILAEVSQTGKQRHIPYRDSRLTFLLQESLGGNAKLAMICSISPAASCRSETLSTLRFAQRAKAIKNKAVVNEETTESDVNFLRDQIRQLKNELMRMKSKDNQPSSNSGYSTGWDARRSYNLLKLSLNRPLTVIPEDSDSDEEMEIDETEVEGPNIIGGNNSIQTEQNQTEIETVDSTSTVFEPENTKISPVKSIKFNTEVAQNCELSTQNQMIRDVVLTDVGAMTLPEPDDMSISPVKQSIETHTEEATQNNDLSLKNDIDSNMVSADDGQETEAANGPSVSIEKVTEVADIGIQAGVQSPEGGAIDEFEFNQMKEQKAECGSLNSYDSSLAVPESHNSAANGLALSIMPYPTSPISTSPPMSTSPRISQSRKSESKSVSKSLLSASNENTDMGFLNLSFAQTARKSMSSASKADNTSPSDRLAETLHRGLQVYDQHKQQVAARKSTVRFSMQAFNNMNTSNLLVDKVDKSVQTSQELQAFKNMEPSTLLVDKVEKCLQTSQELQLAVTDSKRMNDETVLGKISEDGEKEHDKSQWQLTPVEARKSVGEQQSSLSSAVEGVLAGSIRREIAMEEVCNRQAAEIEHLNRLVRQYKHERECNSIIQQAREEKIVRLEGLMDGVITGEEFLKDELESLSMEYKLLEEKYQNHPDVTSAKIERIRLVEELNNYRNFYDLGERDVLLEEMKNLRTQLQYYLDRDGSRGSAKKMRQSLMTQSMQKIGSSGPSTQSLCLATIPELPSSTVDINLMSDEKWEEENRQWTERESEWISLVDDLRAELDSVNHLAEKRQKDLESEQKCSEELKEALQMAMEGHARILDQYAELQEKHIALLAKHRKIREGVSEAKKSALARGIKGAELELIEAQAAELAALKLEREKERRNLQEEIDGLQGQLRDTVEAVQAAGELVVRLKEAEEAVTIAQDTATRSEQEREELRRDIERLKRRHVTEIATMNQRLLESRLQKASVCPMCQVAERAKYEFPPTDEASLQAEISARDVEEDTKNIEELSNEIDENEDLLRKDLHSWFRGYDKCNI